MTPYADTSFFTRTYLSRAESAEADRLHVASALVLRCDTFWSFDPKASKLAALAGLKVRE